MSMDRTVKALEAACGRAMVLPHLRWKYKYTSRDDTPLHPAPQRTGINVSNEELMPCPYFGPILDEIWMEVAAHLDTPELLSLSRTCHRLLNICIPFIYDTVDLSTHNRGIVEMIGSSPVWSDDSMLGPPSESTIRQQRVFLDTLTKHPEYGKYVCSFTWTLVLHLWIPEEQRHEDAEPPAPVTGFLHYPDTEIWRVLQKLNNVRVLDLGSVHPYPDCPVARSAPPCLFAKATSIRLLGSMSYDLATSVLHKVDPTKLRRLELDNLMDWGQLYDGSHYSIEVSMQRPRIESTKPNGDRGVVFPGPMRGLLGKLEGRCLSLEFLAYRRLGQADYREGYFVPELDEKSYAEWARFLRSVKGTLAEFVFEQGQSSNEDYNNLVGRYIGGYRPMDNRFKQYLFPVLLSEGWKVLKYMEIRGIGQAEDDLVLSQGDLAQLREAVGPDVELVISWKATKSFKHPLSVAG